MDDASRFRPGWADLAAAVPGGVGVHADGGFVHVSPELAAAVGIEADALVGEHWRSLFPSTEADRIEAEALPPARNGTDWTGEVRLDGGMPADLTLSTTERGALVWLVEASPTRTDGRDGERAGGRDGPPAGERQSSPGAVGVRSATEPASADTAGPWSDPWEGRRFVENVVDALNDVLYVVDEDGTLVFWNEALRDRFGYSEAELAALAPADFLVPAESDEVPEDPAAFVDVPDRHNVVNLVTKEGESIPHELHGSTYTDPETGARYRVGIGRDITGRLQRERALKRQRDELATLDGINEVLLATVRELVGTASQGGVERRVCERLVASDRYRFAWVGERELDGDRIVPRVTAGEGDGYLDSVTHTVDEDERGTSDEPVGAALRTGEIQVADAVAPDFEHRAVARERDFESVAAVPLRSEGTVYGVLVVYAAREGAFTPRERDGFDVLGRTVGTVIDAARSRELLFADAVVELEFRVDGGVLVPVAAEADCELELEGYVPSGEAWVVYCAVDGAPPDDVAAAAGADPRVERARTVTAADGGRVELLAGEASLLHAVEAAGATVRTVVAGPDGADLVIEAPVDADVRDLIGTVQETFPDLALVARRERDREVTTVGRPGGLLDALTGRQREALEAAYRAGYFAWPRESTAEEVAASLGLAAPTLHGHLRKAQRTILAALLDD